MIGKLSIQEKRPLAFLTIDVLVFALFHFILLEWILQKAKESNGDLSHWAIAFFSLVPVMIIGRILLYLLFSILNSLLTKQKEETFLIDELGGIIRLKASQFFINTFLIGFLLSIGLLWLNMSITAMFKGFLFSIYGAFIAQQLAEFYYLRKGINI